MRDYLKKNIKHLEVLFIYYPWCINLTVLYAPQLTFKNMHPDQLGAHRTTPDLPLQIVLSLGRP